MTGPLDNYFVQGVEFIELGDYPQAIGALTKALRLSLGDLSEILLYRGIAYAFLEDYQRALADFNEALVQNAYNADVYNERGSIWRLHHEYEHAIIDYNAAIRIDPELTEAYYNRGLAHEELHHYDEAIIDFSQTITLNPSISQAYEARARIYALQQNYDGAITDLQRYLRMGGGREHDNHSEVQSFLIVLQLRKFFRRFIKPFRR